MFATLLHLLGLSELNILNNCILNEKNKQTKIEKTKNEPSRKLPEIL